MRSKPQLSGLPLLETQRELKDPSLLATLKSLVPQFCKKNVTPLASVNGIPQGFSPPGLIKAAVPQESSPWIEATWKDSETSSNIPSTMVAEAVVDRAAARKARVLMESLIFDLRTTEQRRWWNVKSFLVGFWM